MNDIELFLSIANTDKALEIELSVFKESLVKAFNAIIETGGMPEQEVLRYFFDLESLADQNRVHMVIKGEIKDMLSPNAGRDYPEKATVELYGWLFVKLLRENFKDLSKIKRCPVCSAFFISLHKSRKVCYPPKDCAEARRRNYQKHWMKKARDAGNPKYHCYTKNRC